MRFRFLPFMVLITLAASLIKTVDIIKGTRLLSDVFLITSLNADTAPTPVLDPSPPEDGTAVAMPPEEQGGLTNQLCIDTMSSVEKDLLQQLAARREQLDQRQQDLINQTNVLKAASAKLDGKLAALKELKDEVTLLLSKYDEKENTNLESLVKIYENMKPKDAAKIFEGLDMPILLQVVDRMKEAKAAPILALMDPLKARDLTIQLAEQRTLPPSADCF